ncbi:MAG: sensor histidine kinase [Caulobacterales bacterium]
MADDSPLSEPPSPGERRFFWPRRLTAGLLPGGLSARLLVFTALFVILANLLILPPTLAAYEDQWLLDRVRAAEIATFVVEAAPEGKVTQGLSQQILDSAEVVSVAIKADGVQRLVLAAPRMQSPPYLIDLRRNDFFSGLATTSQTLFGGGGMVRVRAAPRYRPGEFVEIVAPDAPLRKALTAYLAQLAAIALFTSVVAGVLVYLTLNFFLVRPMQRITRAMERFRADPDDEAARIDPSGRRDEIGRAEAELARMQADLRTALASRARLAALGEAVAKINHEMRNMLTSAQIASERLAQSGDPKVAQALPRLERALDRAVTLATNVLTYGRSEEPAADIRPTPLRAALEAAAEDARLSDDGVRLQADVGAEVQVLADPEQLHRMLVNLMRNSREAVAGEASRGGVGVVRASFLTDHQMSVIRLADNGPGLPERAQSNLFQPFAGSARRGGTGLGLAIARELAQAHGGDVVLVETSSRGAVFDVRLPGLADPLPPKGGGRRRKVAKAP